MNWGNLLWILCAAAHTAAAIFSTFLEIDLVGIQRSGLWAWAVLGVCLILLVLDLTGRLSLRGSGGKMLAALAFPLLCSCGEALILDEYVLDAAPAVWAWFFPRSCWRGTPCWERRNRPPRETKRRPCWSRGVRWG